MADYEKDLGTISSLLHKILEDLSDIKSKLDFELPTLLWYDSLLSYTDMKSGKSLPKKNTANRLGLSVLGVTEMPHILDECGFNYEIKGIGDWDDRYSNRNNLYFIEITQVHLGLERFFEFIPKDVIRLCQEGKLAFVWWFPHEGFDFEGLRRPSQGRTNEHGDAGWFERFTDKFFDIDIDSGKHYFVFGNLRSEISWHEWSEERPEKKDLFKSVIGIDYFNYHYYMEYVNRTQLKFDSDTTISPIENYETHGYVPEAKVRNVYVEPYTLLDNFEDNIVLDDEEHFIRSREVMRDVPKASDKTKDLICFNARVRPSRTVMVSELFRLGYNNDNSHISWLERNEDDTGRPWKKRCFRELDGVKGKEAWVCSDNVHVELMCTKESREHFYDFWEKNTGPIICDSETASIDLDDRTIPLDVFNESFFFLITETLFGQIDKDCLQITEKTYKALAYRIPFIIVGSYGTLEHLRNLGYQTFPHMFDESYDEIPEPDVRMSAICDELKKWRMLTLEEKRDRYQRTIPALMHNYAHFKESPTRTLREFKRIFDTFKLHD